MATVVVLVMQVLSLTSKLCQRIICVIYEAQVALKFTVMLTKLVKFLKYILII